MVCDKTSYCVRVGAGLLLAGALLLASGCSAPPTRLNIDRSVNAKSQNSRVQAVVLHYTSTGNQAALAILSQQNVSSHYLITDAPNPHIYQLVDESRRAWHAGESRWYNDTDLNSSSIGIEIVNLGRGGNGRWDPYRPAQIKALIALLRDIIGRHQIKPFNIVGHSDVAPQRKIDPGPLFPWAQLADAGIGRWYDPGRAARYRSEFEQNGLPSMDWVQRQLTRVGYTVPHSGILDRATRNVLAAFQMHYRPERYDGQPDSQTLAILKALP